MRDSPVTCSQWRGSHCLAIHLHHLLLLSSLFLLPLLTSCSTVHTSISTSSFLDWQFCHFARGADGGWNVTTTGFFVTTPMYSDPSLSTQVAYYTILSISGTRIQSYYGNTSSALITGLLPPGAFEDNDNVLQTYFPTLSVAGLSYQLDRNVTQIGDPALYNQINLYQQDSGPLENGIDRNLVGLSYFVYSAGNTRQPLECPPPPPQVFRFTYLAAPRTFADGLSSSCAVGTLSLLGPYSFIDFVTQAEYASYIVSNSSGVRVFVNASAVQRVSFIGETESDGADFTVYASYPYVDEAGVTLTTTATPLLQASAANNSNPANHWLSISSQDHTTMIEQAYQGDALQMDIIVTPATSPSAFSCTAEVQAIKWDFCFISTGSDAAGRWAVIMNGSLLTTNSLNLTTPSYLVTASQGQRTQLLPDGTVYITPISGVQSLNGYASNPNDNRLYSSHPILSDAGVSLQFAMGSSVVTLPYDYATGVTRIPPVWFSTIHGSPAAERYVDQALVDWSTFVYQRAADQWNLTLPSTLPCALPAQYAAELNTAKWAGLSNATRSLLSTPPVTVQLPFYYSAVPAPRSDRELSYGSSWSVCATGTFQAVGPMTYAGEVVWQVLSVSGQRLFLDERGVPSVSDFTSVSTAGGSNQLLYSAAPFLDSAGISLVLSPFPLFPNAATNVWFDYVRLANGTGETTGTYVPLSTVTFLFSTDKTTTYTCVQPGDHLGTRQDSGVVVLGVAVLLLGSSVAIATVEQIYVSFRHRRPFALLGWLGLSTLAIAVPVWAGVITYYASIAVDCPACLSPLTVSYSLDHLLLASIPALVGVFISVCCMLRSLKEYEMHRVWLVRQKRLMTSDAQPTTVEKSRVAPSVMSGTHTTEAEGSISGFYSRTSPSSLAPAAQGERRLRFSLDHFLTRQRAKAVSTFERLKESYPRHIALAALALTAALVLTRWTLTYMVVDQALTVANPAVDVFSSVLVYVLCYLSLLLYFYSPHFRWLSSVVLTAAVLLDCELHFATDTTRYTPDERWRAISPSAGGNGLSRSELSQLTVVSISAIVGSISLVALVVMLIYRIRSSRRQLAAAMRKTTTKLNSAQSVIQGQKARIARLEVVGVEALKSLEAIALLRPTVQGMASKGAEEQRSIARSMMWAYLGNSSSSSLQRSALQRSAALVAPALFAQRPSSILVVPSGSRALSPSATGNGATIIMKSVRASLTTQGTGTVMGAGGWAIPMADELGGAKTSSLILNVHMQDGSGTQTPPPGVSVSIPSTPLSPPHVPPGSSLTPPNLTPKNGSDALLQSLPLPHRSSATEQAAGEESTEPTESTTATLDPTLMAGLQKLAAHLLVKEEREEELLHQHLAAQQRLSVDAQAQCSPLQLLADEGRSRDLTAILTRLAAATASYRPTLPHILSHPVCAELLKDHMQAAACVENVLFLLAVGKWRLCRSQPLRHSLAVLLFDEFIAEGAVHELNIDATQRAALALSIAAGKGGRAKLSEALFGKVEKEVLMLVETNGWKAFVKTPPYELCAVVLVRNAVVMTALQLQEGEEEVQETAIFSQRKPDSEGEEEDLPGQVKAARQRVATLGGRTDSLTVGSVWEHSVSGMHSSHTAVTGVDRGQGGGVLGGAVVAMSTAGSVSEAG